MKTLLALALALVLIGCGGAGSEGAADTGRDAGASTDAAEDVAQDAAGDVADPDGSGEPAPELFSSYDVCVTLDGELSPGTLVMQGGSPRHVRTGDDGCVRLPIDNSIPGPAVAIASHPEARIGAIELQYETPDALGEGEGTIALTRYGRDDNPDYEFQDPGEPRRRPNTAQCSHCHQTIGDDWFNSRHRQSASNPIVHDLYAGAAHQARSEEACSELGGRWLPGREPGTGASIERCYVGEVALPALNPSCAEGSAGCDAQEQELARYGGCADCHAPATLGPSGELGGQDLLDASEFAHDYGVFCDICHRTESVGPLDAEPGVAGRLALMRPSEPSPTAALGAWLPLTFGPSHDSPNVRMGSVQRDHYRDGQLCSGCHEHSGPPLPPGSTIDEARWPSGELPFQTTYSEWEAGPLGNTTPCNSCHMPPQPLAWNGSDIQRSGPEELGVQGGWYRPAGSVRRHVWWGPRSPQGRMLEHAAALFVDASIEGDEVVARVRVRNSGAGHAVPTGEGLRAMILRVDALCGDAALEPTGGDVVPDIGGALLAKESAQDWSVWPGAQVGDRVRVVERPGGWIDYDGWGPFALGAPGGFSPDAKGMPVESYAGESAITSLTAAGEATFDAPLPEGSVAYLVPASEGRASDPEVDPNDVAHHAGAPGFAFARVAVDAEGRRNVPHFTAVDVASDNRLMPQAEHTTTHRFRVTCEDPVVHARIIHRRYPVELARERGWSMDDQQMTHTRRRVGGER